jgi:TRAP-type uncharacterized transport system substrate-binding protein
MRLPRRVLGQDLRIDRRGLLLTAGGLGACALAGLAPRVLADAPQSTADEQVHFFRIGTGPTSGNYFAIGGLIANAISNPPGSRPCERGGSCGVPGLIAIAQTTQGSVQNIDQIASHTVESALCQSDIAFWAYSGTGMYTGKKAIDGLRAIANLFGESLHIVVRADSNGTRATAALLLETFGLGTNKLVGQQMRLPTAIESLRDGKIDALFAVGGAPIPAIADLAGAIDLRLLPVEGARAEALRRDYPFLTIDIIPADTYRNVPTAITVGIGTYWLVLADLDDALVYGVTQALWHQSTRKLLDESSPMGRRIRIENALVGLPLPLHPGAARYYEGARQQPNRSQ